MKDMMPVAGKWVLLGCILAVLGVFLILGLGRSRGTKLYGLRMSLWRLALALAAGGGLVLASTGTGCKSSTPKEMCYDSVRVTEPAPDTGADREEATGPVHEEDALPEAQEAEPEGEAPPASAANVPEAPAEPVNKKGKRPAQKKKNGSKGKISCYIPIDD